MLLSIAIVLIILWALGVFVARVAGGLIHLIILLALVFGVMHFMRGRRAMFGGHPILHEQHFRD